MPSNLVNKAVTSPGIMDLRETLKKRLADLEDAIAETKRRLPAHSIKPPVMHELLDLEDERDSLLKELAELTPTSSEGESPH